MPRIFREPLFEDRHIELRVEDGEVCIYATSTGLQKIIAFCNQLLENPKIGHVHLEDYELLTSASLEGVIALFED